MFLGGIVSQGSVTFKGDCNEQLLTSTFKYSFKRGLLQALLDRQLKSNGIDVTNVYCGSIVADVVFYDAELESEMHSAINQGNFTIWVGDKNYTAVGIFILTVFSGSPNLKRKDTHYLRCCDDFCSGWS